MFAKLIRFVALIAVIFPCLRGANVALAAETSPGAFGAAGSGAPVPGHRAAAPAPAKRISAVVAAALANDAVLPHVSARARDLYRQGLALGNNPRVFSKVGDSLSVPPFFLASFDQPRAYRLGATYGYLQGTIDHFAGSFARPSRAAHIGWTTTAVLDPLRANAQFCAPGETPLACEYRLNRPSLAFISLGTNGAWLTDADFERDLRQIITTSVESGIVPILATKADDLDGGRFNPIIRRLAAEYDVPLWDYRLAVENLPNHGLSTDNTHPDWAPSDFADPRRLWSGWQLRNLTALEALDRVWQGVQ